jgi:pyruvate formate lyase activating enzyme
VGICGARQGQVERVAPLNYGQCTALALDPIEKKPLARFYPGTQILSYGSYGCNLGCAFCQNWEIAQVGRATQAGTARVAEARFISPAELVTQAVELEARGNIGIALTYNEPLICPEYIGDVAEAIAARAREQERNQARSALLAQKRTRDSVQDKTQAQELLQPEFQPQKQSLKLVLVTNGYVMPAIAEQVFAVVDAANIDLKAFNQEFYDAVGAPAGLSTAKRSIQIAREAGCHVEVTTLVIPGLNDSAEEMEREAAWLASLSPELPLHISAFRPAYKMRDTEATSASLVYELARIAQRHLKYVYPGNV